MRPRQWLRFGRFNLVGLAGAAVQLLAFSLLMRASRLHPAVAAPLAVEIAVLHNFFWHARFTWRDREPAGWRQTAVRFWRFHAANGVVSVLGNMAATYCLVEWFGVPAPPAAILAIAVCMPANFLLADRWVYAGMRQPVEPSRSWNRSSVGAP